MLNDADTPWYTLRPEIWVAKQNIINSRFIEGPKAVQDCQHSACLRQAASSCVKLSRCQTLSATQGSQTSTWPDLTSSRGTCPGPCPKYWRFAENLDLDHWMLPWYPKARIPFVLWNQMKCVIQVEISGIMALLMQWNCIGIGMTHAYVANWGDQLKDAQRVKQPSQRNFAATTVRAAQQQDQVKLNDKEPLWTETKWPTKEHRRVQQLTVRSAANKHTTATNHRPQSIASTAPAPSFLLPECETASWAIHTCRATCPELQQVEHGQLSQSNVKIHQNVTFLNPIESDVVSCHVSVCQLIYPRDSQSM